MIDLLPVSVAKQSANRKLAPVIFEPVPGGRPRPIPQGPFCSSTDVSIWATCPDSCPYKHNGCYKESYSGYNSRALSLDQRAVRGKYTALDVTTAEAMAIDGMFRKGVPQDGARGGRDLRLHVGGDVSCAVGAGLLASAARDWGRRGGGTVWTYTHRWREIPSRSWAGISVLASVEKVEDIPDAHRRGYAAAITLVAFPRRKRFRIPGSPFSIIPCPSETRKRTCVQCRLCFDTERLRREKLVIGFVVHGRDAKKAKKHLRVIQGGALDSVPLELYGGEA